MTKFTVNLSPQQDQLMDSLQETFGAATRAELVRKLLALGLLLKETRDKGQRLLIADSEGRPLELVRLL